MSLLLLSSAFVACKKPFTSAPERQPHSRKGGGALILAAVLLISGCGRIGLYSDEQIDAAYERGLDFIAMYDLNRAQPHLRAAFNAVSEEHPMFGEIGLAYAVSLLHFTPIRAEFISAGEEVLQQVLEVIEDGEVAQAAMIELGRAREIVDFQGDIADVESARVLFRRAYEIDRRSIPGVSALIYLAKTFLKEFDNEPAIREGIALLEGHLEEFPDTVMASVLWQTVGDSYIFNFNEREEALDAYRRVVELGFVDRPRADRNKWRMAGWAEGIGDYDETVRILTSIIVDTPRSPLGTQAREWIVRIRDRFPERGYVVPEIRRFGIIDLDSEESEGDL